MKRPGFYGEKTHAFFFSKRGEFRKHGEKYGTKITENCTWMSRWKLASMVSKWMITYIQMGYIEVITLLLTFDPNFQRDIQL